MVACGLRGQLWPSQLFDGCALQRIELSDNQLEGDLPNLAGARRWPSSTLLRSAFCCRFSSHGSTGGVSWPAPALLSVTLDYNRLVGQLELPGLINRLAYLRLEDNRIQLPPERGGLSDSLLFRQS